MSETEKKTKPNVGDTVWVVPAGRRSRPNPGYAVTVNWVGLKYFTLENMARTKFYNEGWGQVTDYSPYWRLYRSEEDYLNRQYCSELWNEISKKVSSYGRPKHLTLDALKQILQLLEPPQEDS